MKIGTILIYDNSVYCRIQDIRDDTRYPYVVLIDDGYIEYFSSHFVHNNFYITDIEMDEIQFKLTYT